VEKKGKRGGGEKRGGGGSDGGSLHARRLIGRAHGGRGPRLRELAVATAVDGGERAGQDAVAAAEAAHHGVERRVVGGPRGGHRVACEHRHARHVLDPRVAAHRRVALLLGRRPDHHQAAVRVHVLQIWPARPAWRRAAREHRDRGREGAGRGRLVATPSRKHSSGAHELSCEQHRGLARVRHVQREWRVAWHVEDGVTLECEQQLLRRGRSDAQQLQACRRLQRQPHAR
jgi:hypothetical protein